MYIELCLSAMVVNLLHFDVSVQSFLGLFLFFLNARWYVSSIYQAGVGFYLISLSAYKHPYPCPTVRLDVRFVYAV